MGEEQKGGRIVRSGLALTLAGTLMVPSTAAFAADGDDQAQQPSAASAVEQAMQQAQANGTDAQGNVTIIVQLEDGGSQGVSLFSRIMGTVKQSRHSYFKDQIRSMVNEEQAQGIALLSAEDADDVTLASLVLFAASTAAVAAVAQRYAYKGSQKYLAPKLIARFGAPQIEA